MADCYIVRRGGTGGDTPQELDTDGIVGYFDTSSVDLANNIWRNKINGYNDIELSGAAIEDNALKALGGQIGNFRVDAEPKVMYIVVKKNTTENDNCIISIAKYANKGGYGFSIWQGKSYGYTCSQTGSPYIDAVNTKMGQYYCFAIARQSKINSNGNNGLMFFADGKLIGFFSNNYYGDYAGFVTFLRYFFSYGYSPCATDTFLRAVLIGTQEQNAQQIIQNCNYLMKKYM